jgi:hypothetical protein
VERDASMEWEGKKCKKNSKIKKGGMIKMNEKEKERIKERRSVQDRATHTPASQQEKLIYLEEEWFGTCI